MNKHINKFEQQVALWNKENRALAKCLSEYYGFEVKEAFLFNQGLRKLKEKDIKLILVADNPGKEERSQSKYLVGSAGAQARNILQPPIIDINHFESEVMVLNKCPIFTSVTAELSCIARSSKYHCLVKETQVYMAKLMFSLHEKLGVPVFVVGFAGCHDKSWLRLKKDGKHTKIQHLPFFFEAMFKLYTNNDLNEQLYLFKHFSRGQFKADLKAHPTLNVFEIGKKHRDSFFIDLRKREQGREFHSPR